LHGLVPQPSEVALLILKRLPRFRCEDQRRHAIHAVQHPAQRRRAWNLDQRPELATAAGFALAQTDARAVIGRLGEFRDLTLAEMTEALARGWGSRDSRSVMLLQQERAGVKIAVDLERLRAPLAPAVPNDGVKPA
jgi:hypothetical protein